MSAERGGIVGPGGPEGPKFGRADVEKNRVIFDGESIDGDYVWELSQEGDGKYKVRSVNADRIVNFPQTWGADSPTGGFVRQFELRPADQRGADESPIAYWVPKNNQQGTHDIVVLAVTHEDHNRRFTSAPLTWVRK